MRTPVRVNDKTVAAFVSIAVNALIRVREQRRSWADCAKQRSPAQDILCSVLNNVISFRHVFIRKYKTNYWIILILL